MTTPAARPDAGNGRERPALARSAGRIRSDSGKQGIANCALIVHNYGRSERRLSPVTVRSRGGAFFMKTIGIDLGTTTISAAVLDPRERRVVESRTIPNGGFLETGRPWERCQDAAALVRAARELLDGLLETYHDAAAIGLTGQMHGILYLDRAGRALSPLYTWQDGSGEQPCANYPSLTDWIRSVCGVETATGYGLVTCLAHCKAGRLPPDADTVCTIADYLGMVLTGRSRPLLHASNAASLGFFDAGRGAFQREALETLGLNDALLPEVTGRLVSLGAYHGIPVCVAVGDNQASFLGAAGRAEDTVLVNMGTGGQISLLSKDAFTAPGIEARPFLDGTFLLVGSSLCGGRAYAILERFLRRYVRAATGIDEPQYAVMERLARAAADAEDGMRVSTLFRGTRTEPARRGGISNLSEENFTPEGLVYGVLQGMADELHEHYLRIQAGAGLRAKRLIGSGNGLRRNPVLQEVFSKTFQMELSLPPLEEEAACGAAGASLGLV